MSTVTRAVFDRRERAVDVAAGFASGLVAGVFGSIVLRTTGATDVITVATPSMVGLPTPAPVAGLLVFLAVSMLLGIGYAAVIGAVDRRITTYPRGALAGAAYGVALWIAIAVAFVPLALPALGYAAAPAFPYVDPVALVGYVGFGLVLGAFHAALARYR